MISALVTVCKCLRDLMQAVALRSALEKSGRDLSAAEDQAARHGVAVSGAMSAEASLDAGGRRAYDG